MSFKSVIGYGVLAQKESTYATASAFNTTTHAVQVSELPTLAINYVNDGARPNSPSTAGAQPFVSPTGRFAEINYCKHVASLHRMQQEHGPINQKQLEQQIVVLL